MKKHKHFLGRLFRRKADGACDDLAADKKQEEIDKAEVEESTIPEPGDPAMPSGQEAAGSDPELSIGVETEEAPPDFPTLCRGGKLFRARLRNGRWETIGPPIGDC